MTPKFRVWLKKEGNMAAIGDMHFKDGELYFIRLEQIAPITYGTSWNHVPKHKSEDVVLMQSTGAKDKKGAEIFEGDIIEHRYNSPLSGELVVHRFRVAWDEMYSRFCTIGIGLRHGVDLSSSASSRHFEVIGNIYENPEMLEEVEK